MLYILPLTYLGNTGYFTLLKQGNCIIDIYEHYVKQTYRNRCDILTAAGKVSLTVNVVKSGSMMKRPMCDMRIDYSKRWQHQHWMSILSAYKNSPYFDHFRDLFEPFYNKEFTFLADFNIRLLETVQTVLKMPHPTYSPSYVIPDSRMTDMRNEFNPGQMPLPQTTFHSYCQVFGDRLPFHPNLSIIDLLFCEGPNAINLL